MSDEAKRFPLSVQGICVTWGLVRLGSKASGRHGFSEWLRCVRLFVTMLFWWWRLGDVNKAIRRMRPTIDEEVELFMADR